MKSALNRTKTVAVASLFLLGLSTVDRVQAVTLAADDVIARPGETVEFVVTLSADIPDIQRLQFGASIVGSGVIGGITILSGRSHPDLVSLLTMGFTSWASAVDSSAMGNPDVGGVGGVVFNFSNDTDTFPVGSHNLAIFEVSIPTGVSPGTVFPIEFRDVMRTEGVMAPPVENRYEITDISTPFDGFNAGSITVIPEPASLALLLSALPILALRRR